MTATNKNIPGKRLKTWHRHNREAIGGAGSLRRFARRLIETEPTDERSRMERAAALAWAGGKVAP